MMESSEYIKNITEYFGFLVTEFDFKLWEIKLNGNPFYDIQYKGHSRIISISYENVENYFLVTVFILQNGEMPDYEDKTNTLQLKKLNSLVNPKTSKVEIELNTEYFTKFVVKNELERKLIKESNELRLCLNHFKEIHRNEIPSFRGFEKKKIKMKFVFRININILYVFADYTKTIIDRTLIIVQILQCPFKFKYALK